MTDTIDDGGAAKDDLTLRDYFAAQTLTALIARDTSIGSVSATLRVAKKHATTPERLLSEIAYDYADAMIAERARRKVATCDECGGSGAIIVGGQRTKCTACGEEEDS